MDINLIINKLKEKSFKKDLVPKPKDKETFQVPSHLVVEIGCGVGLHPINYALSHPQHTIVAIEHTVSRYHKFFRRIQNHKNISNLIPKHENAISWITHKLPNESVDKIFLLYPNPYPRPKDWNKRWPCMPFFAQLIRTLKKNGQIVVATNEQFYFEESIAINQQFWGLNILEQKVLSPDNSPRTHFEKKYFAQNQNCYNLILEKNK